MTVKKKIRQVAASSIIVLVLSSNTVYGDGWEKEWSFVQENGEKATGWQKLEWNGQFDWYYFDSEGIMQTGWHLIDEKWYYFYDSGEMADGTIELNGEQITFIDGAYVDISNDEAHRKASYAALGRTPEEIAAAEIKIQNAIEYCNQGSSDYERAYRICEWMGENLSYDLHGPYDVVGALITGRTICEGYTDVYRELAERLGFYCERMVSGEMNHAWNYIVVNGVGYYTDVTWDDAGSTSYNMLSRNIIGTSHTIESPQHQ
ncbi:MAG: transglutaminase domain-containing protein [Monoglobales bacterium]